MFYTDDPERDFRRWDEEQEAFRQTLPRCSECNHIIEDERCFNINEEAVCEDCIDRFKVHTTYFMG